MSLLQIAWKSIRQRGLASSLTTLSVTLGVMMMVGVLVIFEVVDRTFRQNSVGYDLIVGPKGSDLQLVLSSIYRVTPPIETLPYQYYLDLKERGDVKTAVPIAIGDTTEQGNFPIVGTTTEYFELEYAPGKNYPVIRDSKKMTNAFDAVIGSEVARQNNWTLGSKFKMVHAGTDAHVHDEEFEVVAVLGRTGTADDRSVFVNLEGFLMLDDHSKPIPELRKRLGEFYAKDPAKLAELMKQLADHEAHMKAEEAAHAEGGHHHHHHHGGPDAVKEVSSVLVVMIRRVDIARERMVEFTKDAGDNPPRWQKLLLEAAAAFEAHEPDTELSNYREVLELLKAVPADDPDGLTGNPRRDSELKGMLQDIIEDLPDASGLLLRSELRKGFQAQGVNPIEPIVRLKNLILGNVQKAMLVMTGMIIIVSGISVFVSIYNSMSDRKREIAIMRALGASRTTVFSIILMESILLCSIGGVLGVLLGHGLVLLGAPELERQTGLLLDPLAFTQLELIIIPVLVVLAALVGLIPALTAYRTDVARTLAE